MTERAGDAVGLDLVAPELLSPMLRKLSLVAAGVGIVVALVSAIWLSVAWAVGLGLLVSLPTMLSLFAFSRRRLSLTGNVLAAHRLSGTRKFDLAQVTGAQLRVYPGRVSRVSLQLTLSDGRAQQIPLALYTDAGGARELHLLGLRKLADALSSSELVAAVAISDVLVGQLRAEARDAGLADRPLYRAVGLARSKDAVSPVVLTDQEVVELG
ncbi:hypothetical protein [Nocardia camponoti]|uniref:Uncharacterized protein n=1 Tax=Nocardia camponoti TaxID=1616106 RepID=A0A917V599_9NOCA|nr:hypothetical protein [Nocardia camponoti]GGK39652.1 hypothetical protein GCM10011591_09210 [Nocardia camponoti]